MWLWPDKQRSGAPQVLRLIRLEVPRKGQGRQRSEMWLVTDVLDPQLLTRPEAGRFYAKRWPANECTFRTWKTTLNAAKLLSRTPIMAEPEAENSLCALMLLQISVALARRAQRRDRRTISVARAKRTWCRALRAVACGRRIGNFRAQLRQCVCDVYRRRKPKVRRPWPERKEFRALKTPIFRKLSKRRKALGLLRLEEQQRATA